ncbi:phosphonate ABC transporter substrate-binding protein [Leucobacter sp. OLIS6]|uniref:phosphate/phosphite/phosphonate ABC transporter substrate-binding protein n=1 Tax=unclassified Leucobacter TaxID=2621730 RepID=UPI000C18EC1A|nr:MULTISPECIES: phosphate/phosphite/phosphonate ABC transporter substrate-binding protein [unclassified Leucobacter]PII82209.1 phosphonate ABC transporter substrate-binding protein [Leucobacter sp. OLCALW19]PII88495.1 phosphonate ABC transporter substrate-binding protein [Leucobacter sp. OLTLW20]PII94199.1 phosphonate ABC transporter substrate-binding protein [Leucobacter sp. OLAS13]PII98229.1 phosphonate ABC transporter substrate-binding protein [Leucobacter sp. OLDS2]PIJ03502.1 phosphonate 
MRKSLAIAASAAALLALGLTGCSSAASGTAAAGKDVTCPNGKIKFGILPYEDPSRLEPAYKTLAKALEKKLDCPVEVVITEDYAAEVLAMENGKLDVAEFGPLGFVFASERAGAVPLVSFGDAEGKPTTYTAGIWVKKDSPVKTLDDLKGHTLALGSPGSTSGDAFPMSALKDAGIDKEVRSDYAGGHPEALLALVNGTVDAAQINSQTLESAKSEGKFDESKFRQVWKSNPIPNDPITVRSDAPQEFQDAVKKAFLELDPKDVAEVGKFLDVDPAGPMIEVTKETYQPLFDLAKTMGLTEKDV